MNIIYGLMDPLSLQIRYVGFTTNPVQRLEDHHDLSKLKGFSHKENWIKSLLNAGLKAKMIILQEYSTSDLLPAAERRFIAYYKEQGYNLTNSTDGGEGVLGYRHTQLTKNKISAANKGRIFSDERKQQISNFMKGKKNTLGMKLPSRKHTDETKNKISSSLLGRKATDETRIKLSEAKIGKPSNTKGKTWRLIDGKRIYT